MNDFLSEIPGCTEVKPLLSAYFDGELPDGDMEIVENHLANCPECLRELKRLEEFSFITRTSVKKHPEKALGLLPEDVQKCLKTTADISAFIDGELDHAATRAMLEHIISCKYCRKQYDKIKKTSELTKKCLKLPVMDEIQSRKMRATVINRLDWKKKSVKMLPSAAAVAFIAVLSWFSISHFTPIRQKDTYIDNTKYVKDEKPLYVQSEDYVLSDLDLEPPAELVLMIYGDNGK